MRYAIHLLTVVVISFASCKKDQLNNGRTAISNHLSPDANAGPDQDFLTIPDSIVLDGRASTTAGGNSTFYWREISGPGSPANILSPSLARTVVKNIIAGTYQFELRVTGNGGLYALDTVQARIQNTVTTVTGSQTGPPPGQEYTFQTKWSFWTDAMGDDIYLSIDPSQFFSAGTMATSRTEVAIQLDSSSVWTVAPLFDWYNASNIPPPHNDGYVWEFGTFPYDKSTGFEIENYPLNYKLVNQPVKVRVRFL